MATLLFSLWAYLWMWLVLTQFSENVVEIWEALVTLLFMVLLLISAYSQDKSWFGIFSSAAKQKVKPEEHLIGIVGKHGEHHQFRHGRISSFFELEGHKDELANILKSNMQKSNSFDKKQFAYDAMKHITNMNRMSPMRYRMDAIRYITGGKRVAPDLKAATTSMLGEYNSKLDLVPHTKPEQEIKYGFCFSSCHYSVHENEGKAVVSVIRNEKLDMAASISYETSNGLATAGQDYEYTSGVLKFEPNETTKIIEIPIIDDNVYEPDESFYIAIKAPLTNGTIGETNIAEVTIIDDDSPGIFSFSNGGVIVKETDSNAKVEVTRSAGIDGKVQIKYSTKDISAKASVDYHGSVGILNFNHGEKEKIIELPLIDGYSYTKNLAFAVEFEILNYPDCGAQYGSNKVCIVTITNDENFKDTVDQISTFMKLNLEKLEIGSMTWTEQVRISCLINLQINLSIVCIGF